jgi:hypothetical protein
MTDGCGGVRERITCALARRLLRADSYEQNPLCSVHAQQPLESCASGSGARPAAAPPSLRDRFSALLAFVVRHDPIVMNFTKNHIEFL